MWFGVLGALRVVGDGAAVIIDRPRHRALLGFLLLHANRPVTTGALIEAMWGGRPPGTARTQVHAMVSTLRRSLADAGDRERISTVAGGYLCSVADDELDLAQFDAAVAEAKTIGDAAQAGAAWRAALALWRGPVLDGVDAPYVEAARAALWERRIAAHEKAIDLDLALRRHADVVPELTELVAANPVTERLVEQLMLALWRCGRQADALREARELRARLAEQLGLDPGRSFTDLEQAIRTQDPALSPAAPAAPVPAQLPAPARGFTGRRAQIEHLDTLVADQVCVLTGAGGVGKTTLAVRWALRERERFADGQLYANLNGYALTPPSRPIDVLARFLRALGVAPDQVPMDAEEAAALYRSLLADRRMLVVLDNAANAEQVRPLLPGSPACLALVTSRDRLAGLVARDGARRLDLDVLPRDEAAELVATIIGADRAAAEAAAVGELVELCGGLPLALRIAAATLADQPDLGVADYAEHLRAGDRLSELEIDGDDTSSVSATFALSYQGLPEDLRSLFRLLGALPVTDFSADLAAALAGVAPTDARRLLNRLADVHLIERSAPGRYTFHDLVRLFAHRRAETDHNGQALAAAGHRVREWYLTTARAAAQRLYPGALRLPAPPGPPSPAGLDWLEAERANLVAVIRHCAEHGPTSVAWLLADTLRGYFYLRRYPVDWFEAAGHALTAAAKAGDTQAQASARLSLGHACLGVNDTDRAITEFDAALELAQASGWSDGVGTLHNNLGLVYLWRGELRAAREHLAHAVALLPGETAPAQRATTLSNLGYAEHALGTSADPLDLLAEALRLHGQVGNADGQVDTLVKTGLVHRDEGRVDQAASCAAAAAAIARDTGSAEFHVRALVLSGSVHLLLNHLDQAAADLETALSKAREADFTYGVADAQLYLARVDLGRGDPAGARDRVAEAKGIADKYRYRLLQGDSSTALAEVDLAVGDLEEAAHHAAHALRAHGETGSRAGLAAVHEVLARLPVELTSRTSSPCSSSSAPPSTE
ncbi:BTAD domain-containing putative transcriptional regulator [Alloactinosynnema sp. L-07]|uniref:AfsR/SARP family transcriptional regulator n=1 Tax=Alloactinosynnema sp. L-07 TaxID=1653480 RepID=UPI0006B46C24|nr:BTAD domain-containing putative transcriptional regulator [Alloactinosynnema sp. L-07]